VKIGKFLVDLRDRVIHRSQLGKRKLDLAFTRRELDDKLRELGERFRRLAREGRVTVPADLENAVAAVRDLEETLASQQGEVARIEREAKIER
jgi:hypothetical protein